MPSLGWKRTQHLGTAVKTVDMQDRPLQEGRPLPNLFCGVRLGFEEEEFVPIKDFSHHNKVYIDGQQNRADRKQRHDKWTCPLCSASQTKPQADPPCPQDLFKIMQFPGNFKGKPLFSAHFGLEGPSLGSQLHWASPLTKILHPPLKALGDSGLWRLILKSKIWNLHSPQSLQSCCSKTLPLFWLICLVVNQKFSPFDVVGKRSDPAGPKRPFYLRCRTKKEGHRSRLWSAGWRLQNRMNLFVNWKLGYRHHCAPKTSITFSQMNRHNGPPRQKNTGSVRALKTTGIWLRRSLVCSKINLLPLWLCIQTKYKSIWLIFATAEAEKDIFNYFDRTEWQRWQMCHQSECPIYSSHFRMTRAFHAGSDLKTPLSTAPEPIERISFLLIHNAHI